MAAKKKAKRRGFKTLTIRLEEETDGYVTALADLAGTDKGVVCAVILALHVLREKATAVNRETLKAGST